MVTILKNKKAIRTPTTRSSSSSSSNTACSSSSSNSPIHTTKTNFDSPVRKELDNFNISTKPARKRQARDQKEKNDDTEEDVDDDSSSTLNSRSSRKSLFLKEKICNGYDPKIQNFFLNFPFQVLGLYPDRINFIVTDNKLHSKECAENFFLLIANHSDNSNKTCNNLHYDTFLQGI